MTCGIRKQMFRASTVLARASAALLRKPTLLPPPGYSKLRADWVYGGAFLRCFEYLSATRIEGDILEFGSFRGFTARKLAKLITNFDYPARLFLFDSFEGLPEVSSKVDQASYEVEVNRVWFKGQMGLPPDIPAQIQRALQRIIAPSRLSICKGFFEDTLEKNLPANKAALIHLDCDFYSSAKYVLERLLDRELFQDGSLLVLDDYNCNRSNPQMGERAAVSEAFANHKRFHCSDFFSYGWHGQVMFVHDRLAAQTLHKD